MKNNKGFTLIELAVVLAIIAVLAAVLTPVVTGYLEQARLSRAQADVRTIADAIKLYHADTGVWPFFDSAAYAATGSTVADGTKIMIAGTGGTAISSETATTANTSLETYLNTNVMTRSTTAGGGRTRFAGPYLGNVDGDPWNNKYYVDAGNLATSSTYWAFVFSVGPDGALDTSKTQAKTGAFAVGDDDIAAAIH